MRCPQCGAKTHAYESREIDGGVVRLRRCKNAECNYSFVTWEAKEPDNSKWKAYCNYYAQKMREKNKK